MKRPPSSLTGIGCGSRGRLALSHGFAPPPRVSPSPPTRLAPQGKGVFQELSSISLRDPLVLIPAAPKVGGYRNPETKGFGKIHPLLVAHGQATPHPDSVANP